MPLDDDQAPATKKDLQHLAAITKKDAKNLRKLASANAKDIRKFAATNKKDLQGLRMEWKNDLKDTVQLLLGTMEHFHRESEERMHTAIQESERRTRVVMEHQYHDVLGLLNDIRSNGVAVADHEQRIGRLERHAGIAA